MRRIIAVSVAALSVAGAAVAAAAPASAIPAPIQVTENMVWVQQYERPSADDMCDDPPASLDIPWQSDWGTASKAFHPSYAEWANDGKGGWVCTRSIPWANGAFEVPQPL